MQIIITKIENGRLITDKIEQGKKLIIQDGVIVEITENDMYCDITIDMQGHYVSPGFIDIHTHGGGGQDFMDGGINPIAHAAKIHLDHGTTTIIPTTLASDILTLKKTIADIRDAMKFVPTIYGMHLEGPCFSIAQCGAQNPLYITNPIEKDCEEIIELGKGIIKRWSFAPELVGSERFIKTLIKSDIIPSIAHSDGTYNDFVLAYNLGCRLVTHLYSGMSMLTRKNGYRRLGIVECALLFDDVMVEVIADGVHLPPIRDDKILNLPHFPTPLQALVFRLWDMVAVKRIAKVIKTTEENVYAMATQMGLPPQNCSDEFLQKGYISIIRAVWYLFPYEQLLYMSIENGPF